ncbi:hypothetical protein VP01_2082g5, partial [Puccinia sorghi]
FNGIMECAWKATAYSHLTLPSHIPSNYLQTRMGLSCQFPKNTQAALEKIKQNFNKKKVPLRATGVLGILTREFQTLLLTLEKRT